MDNSIKLLRIKEAAELLGVNPATLRKWDKEGKLPAIKISKRGDRRYKKEDIVKFLEKLK
jgi:DNA (cytosine-5)-methyltransferase 1